ncbi:MAG: hypothetical protein M9927_09035 [Anaerolineae bacterium]|nr:hypothetical protein [Anaerolineae bacterium]
MKLAAGDMWSAWSQVDLQVTCSTLRRDGALVMGRGIAKSCHPVALALQPGQLHRRLGSSRYSIILSAFWLCHER